MFESNHNPAEHMRNFRFYIILMRCGHQLFTLDPSGPKIYFI